MLTKLGIAVSPGVAIAHAFVLGVEDFRIPQRFVSVDAVESELVRFRVALENVCREIAQNEKLASEQLGKEYGAIFAAHQMMVRDPKLQGEIEKLIREQHYSPEFALSRVIREYAKVLQNLGNLYMAERAIDIFDLERRLLRELLGERREELAHVQAPVIVLAHDLTPSETAGLNKQFVMGFATEGRRTHQPHGHPGRGFGNPGRRRHRQFSDRRFRRRDGHHRRQRRRRHHRSRRRHAQQVPRTPPNVPARMPNDSPPCGRSIAETKDGTRIALMGNIEFPEEAEHCRIWVPTASACIAQSFCIWVRVSEQSEEDHFDAYRRVVEAFPTRPVVIRTLDLGADKVPMAMPEFYPEGLNPELGLRSIRLSLTNLKPFKTQLRAILRVADLGDVRLMFPLVSSLMELRQAKSTAGRRDGRA